MQALLFLHLMSISITVSKEGPIASEFTKEELEVIDIENLVETVYDIEFKRELTDDDLIGIAELLKLETKLPLKYLKPIQNSCIYIAAKSKLEDGKDFEHASVQIEPINPDWANGQIRFLPINQSIPIDTIFTISKTIPVDGNYEWVMSSDLKPTKDLRELILQENPNAKSFVLTNQKVYLFGQDIGSKLEGKFKVSWTDSIFDSLRLFRFKRPKINHLQFYVYDFMDVSLKMIMDKALSVTHSKECKKICEEIIESINAIN